MPTLRYATNQLLADISNFGEFIGWKGALMLGYCSCQRDIGMNIDIKNIIMLLKRIHAIYITGQFNDIELIDVYEKIQTLDYDSTEKILSKRNRVSNISNKEINQSVILNPIPFNDPPPKKQFAKFKLSSPKKSPKMQINPQPVLQKQIQPIPDEETKEIEVDKNKVPSFKTDMAEIQKSILGGFNQEGVDKETVDLIKKFEEEDIAEIESKQQKATCPICLADIKMQECGILDKCTHMFHKECMAQYLINAIDTKAIPCKCPVDKCGAELNASDIRSYLDKDTMQIYEQIAFKHLIETNPTEYSCCPTPDCQYIFVYTQGVDMPRLLCPICTHDYCLDCKCVFHNGMTCKEYKINNTFSKEDMQFNDFVKGQKFKQCPKCKFWVEKNQGCNHMTCRCGMQFCYACGGNYPNCLCVKK